MLESFTNVISKKLFFWDFQIWSFYPRTPIVHATENFIVFFSFLVNLIFCSHIIYSCAERVFVCRCLYLLRRDLIFSIYIFKHAPLTHLPTEQPTNTTLNLLSHNDGRPWLWTLNWNFFLVKNEDVGEERRRKERISEIEFYRFCFSISIWIFLSCFFFLLSLLLLLLFKHVSI